MDTEIQSFEAPQVKSIASKSIDFLAGLAAPLVYKFAFPPLYISLFHLIKEKLFLLRDFSQIAIGLPRGFAKTFFIKIIVVYIILFTKKQFILILCETEAKAVSIISDVADMLDESNIVSLFGNWRVGLSIDQQAKKVFGFNNRNIILKGAGAGTSIRGVTEKNRRPDVTIFDDIQSKEDAENKLLADKLMVWMVGTAMKTKSPEGCLFLFIANMYPYDGSLLKQLKNNPNWIKFIVGGILQDGTSLWEELQPISQLIKEFQNDKASGHPEIFYSEVLNDSELSINRQIDLNKIPAFTIETGDIPSGKFILVDPSNDKTKSDHVAIGAFYIYDTKPSLMEVQEGIMSPGDIIKNAIKVAFTHGISYIVIEAVAFQYSLLYWARKTCDDMGITGLFFEPIYPGVKSKTLRIVNSFPMLMKGDILLHPSARPAVYSELSQFNALKTDNKDNILDLLTYAHKVIEEYGPQIIASSYINESESEYSVQEHNSPF
jgi:hypothetical protein